MNSLLRSVNTHICKYTRTHTENYICDYKDDVLDKHALLGSGGTKCKGFTATNKPCGRKAVCRGYCRGHVEQGVAKQALDNKGTHYSTTTIKKGGDDAILNVLSSKLGANVSVENVQKTTETVTLKRRRPNVAHPSEEDTLAEELGEDAELQAAIAASLGK